MLSKLTVCLNTKKKNDKDSINCYVCHQVWPNNIHLVLCSVNSSCLSLPWIMALLLAYELSTVTWDVNRAHRLSFRYVEAHYSLLPQVQWVSFKPLSYIFSVFCDWFRQESKFAFYYSISSRSEHLENVSFSVHQFAPYETILVKSLIHYL